MNSSKARMDVIMSEVIFMLNFEIRDACEPKLQLTFHAKQDLVRYHLMAPINHFRRVSQQYVRIIASSEILWLRPKQSHLNAASSHKSFRPRALIKR